MSVRIAIYKFQEAKEVIQRLPLIHLIFLMLLMPWMLPDWTAGGHAVICMISGFCLVTANYLFDLDNDRHQWLPGFIYLILLMVEFSFLELLTIDLVISNNIISKGILFELLVQLLPWMYLGTRVFFIIPFITFFHRGRKLVVMR